MWTFPATASRQGEVIMSAAELIITDGLTAVYLARQGGTSQGKLTIANGVSRFRALNVYGNRGTFTMLGGTALIGNGGFAVSSAAGSLPPTRCR